MNVAWAYSENYGQICQVIEAQTLWGETTCRVWLPGRGSVVRIPASRLKSLESAGTGSSDDIAYVAAAARVADALTQDVLLAPIDPPSSRSCAKTTRDCAPRARTTEGDDLEKLRERSLIKEFEEYRTSSQKRLKVFRLEAVRGGFKKAWQDKSENGYRTIIEVAKKIPENILQEDPKFLMWYDQALTRIGGEK